MTNKEASKVLEHIKFNENYELYIDKEDVEAINLAIKALEECANNAQGDLISRGALRNEIDSWGCNDYDKYDFLDAIDHVPTINIPNCSEFMAKPTEVIKVGEPLSNSDEIKRAFEKGEIYKQGYEDAKKEFERPHGEWIECGGNVACSNCYAIWLHRRTDFCPNCGAKMRDKDELMEADNVKPCSSCAHFNNGNRKPYPCGSCFINSHNMWEADHEA